MQVALLIAGQELQHDLALTAPPSLSPLLSAQVFLEDAGFDWKILGPDVHEFDHVAWQVCSAAWSSDGGLATRRGSSYAVSAARQAEQVQLP